MFLCRQRFSAVGQNLNVASIPLPQSGQIMLENRMAGGQEAEKRNLLLSSSQPEFLMVTRMQKEENLSYLEYPLRVAFFSSGHTLWHAGS